MRVLRERVARRIAAGEVIERPASVVRELLDNAIDAGAGEISVYIEDGGIGRVRVVDNGLGMSAEDLALCCLPHATSKIESEEDLYRITSLGFRGEALASIAAVSRLEITSGTREPLSAGAGASASASASAAAYKVVNHGGEEVSFGPSKGNVGTIVDASDLFYAIPARRRFMKKAQAESLQCKSVFLEKAVAFPAVSFKFFVDGALKVFLPASDMPARISSAYGELDRRFLYALPGEGEGFKISLAACGLELARRDRRFVQIYVNHRRIWEYALSQGVEYVYGQFLPGGQFPCCFVFVEVSPELVDFNIHPAKKEAKIKNVQDIRQRITEVLDSFLRQLTVQGIVSSSREGDGASSLPFAEGEREPLVRSGPGSLSGWGGAGGSGGFRGFGGWGASGDCVADEPAPAYGGEAVRFSSGGGLRFSQGASLASLDRRALYGDAREGEAEGTFTGRQYDFIYRGQVFGLFLVAERGESLFLVDQHAAHEKIIYERLSSDTYSQSLLIPCEFEADDDEADAVAARNAQEIAPLGIRVQRRGPGRWAVTALPESYRGCEGDIIKALCSHHGAAGSLKKALFADIACKNAIKDGASINPLSACEIIQAAFAFHLPRCPHGRPLWFEVSREELFRRVGRIV